MGEPVRIRDLAEQMVALSGLQLKDQANPHGDIEIQYTGLRPGEKLYEELLIDAEVQPTRHDLIFCAKEACWPAANLNLFLDQLQYKIHQQDLASVLGLLKQLVPEWNPEPSCSLPPKLIPLQADSAAAASQAG